MERFVQEDALDQSVKHTRSQFIKAIVFSTEEQESLRRYITRMNGSRF